LFTISLFYFLFLEAKVLCFFHFSPQKYDIFLIQANNHAKLSQEKAERHFCHSAGIVSD